MDGVPMCSVRFGRSSPTIPHRVFAGIQPIAFVCNELLLDVGVCILRTAYSLGICRELGIAIFTYAKHTGILFSRLTILKLHFAALTPTDVAPPVSQDAR